MSQPTFTTRLANLRRAIRLPCVTPAKPKRTTRNKANWTRRPHAGSTTFSGPIYAPVCSAMPIALSGLAERFPSGPSV